MDRKTKIISIVAAVVVLTAGITAAVCLGGSSSADPTKPETTATDAQKPNAADSQKTDENGDNAPAENAPGKTDDASQSDPESKTEEVVNKDSQGSSDNTPDGSSSEKTDEQAETLETLNFETDPDYIDEGTEDGDVEVIIETSEDNDAPSISFDETSEFATLSEEFFGGEPIELPYDFFED